MMITRYTVYFTGPRRRQHQEEPIRLDALRLAPDHQEVLRSSALHDTWRHLRQFRPMGSRRLNEGATIARTLEAGGYFRPIYRDRQVPPAYLLLIDRRHAEDHAAAMADELGLALQRENILVSAFHFYEDPRFCMPVGELAMERSPAALAGVYGDRHVFVAGDAEAFCDRESGEPQSWVEEFACFERKYLLTTEPVWRVPSQAAALEEAGFRVLPLTTEGLSHLSDKHNKAGADDLRDLPLPRRLTGGALSWLGDHPWPRRTRQTVLRDLQDYLGQEGFQLLCATAAYPGLYWGLTRALDAQLELAAHERGFRLRKLARLPWFRHGRMPDHVRLALLRHLDRNQRRRISDTYHALLQHRTHDSLELPVAVPDWERQRGVLREMAQGTESHEPLGDRVFADVVRGRKPRALEFGLDFRGASGGFSQAWRGLLRPMLVGLALVPLAIWANVWLWHTWGGPAAHEQALTTMQSEHQQVQVQLLAPDRLQPVAQALEHTLTVWGFQVKRLPPSNKEDATSAARQITRTQKGKGARPPGSPGNTSKTPLAISNNLDGNTLSSGAFMENVTQQNSEYFQKAKVRYRAGQEPAAKVIAERVAYLYYGETPQLEVGEGQVLGEAMVRVDLDGTPRGFRDPLKAATAKFRDRLKNGQDGPSMVMIPGGVFKMGDSESLGHLDKLPVHDVTVAPFAMSLCEVTFAEYEVFAKATGRTPPDDGGWGRGQRPVINVSWQDATEYAAWVSEQTGKPYRLPTEAEWEYAARSGNQQDTWAGTSDYRQLDNYAVFRVVQTAEVGSKQPNGFGLYDLSGNVWEWVEDCWHEDYQGAPADGSAWGEAGGGDCGQRVVRGGSWDNDPDGLRSSTRIWNSTDFRLNYLGFRLAQGTR